MQQVGEAWKRQNVSEADLDGVSPHFRLVAQASKMATIIVDLGGAPSRKDGRVNEVERLKRDIDSLTEAILPIGST